MKVWNLLTNVLIIRPILRRETSGLLTYHYLIVTQYSSNMWLGSDSIHCGILQQKTSDFKLPQSSRHAFPTMRTKLAIFLVLLRGGA